MSSRAVRLWPVLAALMLTACKSDSDMGGTDVGYLLPHIEALSDGSLLPSQMHLRLTNAATGKTYVWESLDDFDRSQGFLAGTYLAEAFFGPETMEGYDAPYYFGSTEVNVTDGTTTSFTISAKRSNTVVTLAVDNSFSSKVKTYEAIFHSVGGAYFPYDTERQETLYLKPGQMEMYLSITLPDERKASVLAFRGNAKSAGSLSVSLSCTDDAIIVSDGFTENTIELSDDLFTGKGPEISPIGFTPGTTLQLTDGLPPEHPVGMSVTSASKLSEAIFTIQNPALSRLQLPEQVNLLDTGSADTALLRSLGLNYSLSASGNSLDINLTDFLGSIVELVPRDASPSFSLMAVDKLDRVSTPLTLTVRFKPLEIIVTQTSVTVIGSSEATITVKGVDEAASHLLSIFTSSDGSEWQNSSIRSVKPTGNTDEYKLTFALPEQPAAAIKISLRYLEEELSCFDLQQKAPPYSIAVDPFSHHIKLRVNAETDEMRRFLTSALNVYINGAPANVYDRNPNDGLIAVASLAESSEYTLTTTPFTHPTADDFSAPVQFITEDIVDLPNGGFEQIEKQITMAGVPMGGTYSQTSMPVYNRQNSTDYHVSVPEGWATVNDKTCCAAATNINTWYVIPSTSESSNIISGAVSVHLQSVAFDPAGEQITPYRQLKEPFVNYNPNVPVIRYRAAGKIFLGSYAYDPTTNTEQYQQGIDFSSRPSAINGIYRYQAGANAPSDCGRVDIRVLGIVNGKEQVIAANSQLLYPAFTNAAFSVPLTYSIFGVKATKLCVMVSSSRNIGDIATETAGIVTSDDIINSRSTGSILDIDQLTLSY